MQKKIKLLGIAFKPVHSIHLNTFLNGHYITEILRVLCTKPYVRNGRCEYRYVLGLLVYGKVVVDFGRKVFFADCLAWKTFHMARINRTERTQALPCTQNNSCTHSRKHERDATFGLFFYLISVSIV